MTVGCVRLLLIHVCLRVGVLQGQAHPKAWDDCYHCKFTFANETVCRSLLKWDKQPCHAPPFLTLSVSMYAAQLSWWFAHFPKEKFMFITSNELRKGDPIAPLNKVVQFMDMDIPDFRKDMLKNVWGYNGGYNRTELTPLDLHAVRFLHLFFRQSSLDLAELLKDDESFLSIPPEIVMPTAGSAASNTTEPARPTVHAPSREALEGLASGFSRD